MKLRKILAWITVLALCLTLTAGAWAYDEPAGNTARTMPSARYLGNAADTGSEEPAEETTVDLTLDPELLKALGVEIAVEDGVITLSLGSLLQMLGARVDYDEATSTLTVTDESGLIRSLLGMLAG